MFSIRLEVDDYADLHARLATIHLEASYADNYNRKEIKADIDFNWIGCVAGNVAKRGSRRRRRSTIKDNYACLPLSERMCSVNVKFTVFSHVSCEKLTKQI